MALCCSQHVQASLNLELGVAGVTGRRSFSGGALCTAFVSEKGLRRHGGGLSWSASAAWEGMMCRGVGVGALKFGKRGLNGVVRAEAGMDGDEREEGRREGYVPSADFYKIEAMLRPWRLTHVTSSLIRMGIRGVTVTDVRGFGSQGGSRERQAGSEFSEDDFVTKVKLEVVVCSEQVEEVIDTIIGMARTGEIGDGKIFVSPVADIIRVRTGERGLQAERMAGGRFEILHSTHSN